MRTPCEIGIDRRIDARLDQIPLLDQLGDLRAFDDGLEDPAEPTAVAPAWRGSQSQQDRVRIGIDDLAIGFGRAVVRLIDHQQIGRRQVHDLGADRAPVQCLNRGDLHILQRPRRGAGHDDAVRNRDVAQLLAGLGDDLAPVREHKHALPSRRSRLDDGAGDQGFAGIRSARPA